MWVDRINEPNIVITSRHRPGLTKDTSWKKYDLAQDATYFTDNPACSFLGKMFFFTSWAWDNWRDSVPE